MFDYDAKSDVWSLGVILYEMCYSDSPFRATNTIEELEREILGYRSLFLSLFLICSYNAG